MIINTGSRTDIPGFYSKWFYNRIKEGFVMTRNPYNIHQVTKYRLEPEVVDCLAFCTKNPAPMLLRIHELDAFRQFWFVTLTPYGKDVEPNVPNKYEVIESFQKLSNHVGPSCIGWRYDPIFITDRYTTEYHIKSFEKIASMLSGYTKQCVISFIDLYEKTKRNFRGVTEPDKEQRQKLGSEFARIGKEYGIKIYTCCEGIDLVPLGIDASGCMTKEVIERAIGERLLIPKSVKPARMECNCLLGNDIGMYNTCLHDCLYCYANQSKEMVRKNYRRHDENSPFLIGGSMEEDLIKEAKQQSYIDPQIRFTF